jgi:glycoprotein endo-alpha-1,2-mannosidase
MRNLLLLAIISAFWPSDGLLAESAAGAAAPPPCASRVMAFYYGWYGGAPAWRHWADADPSFPHDPDTVVTSGPQYPGGVRRDIAATDYPLLGPYDSQTASVIDQHLAWAEEAGIDVLISSWWGPGTYEDATLGLLLDRVENTGSAVRVSVYLETWALFYGHQFQADFADPRNFAPDSRAQIRQKAVDWIAHLLTTHGNRPGLEHVAKGGTTVPVIFVYTAALFAPVEWQDIFDRVRQATGIDAFYQADVEGADFDALGQVFDGLHVYTPVHLTAEGDLSFAARTLNPQATVDNPAKGITDPLTVGADYGAWATEARLLGKSWAATVIPGFDDRKIRNPSFFVSRTHGQERTYDFFWRQALLTHPDWVLITSFNEWHEGTEIEPSVEYEDEFLTRTRLWSNQVHDCESADHSFAS